MQRIRLESRPWRSLQRLGPYEISALIGAGGMGEVYRATDTNLKRAVAIKVLPDSVSNDPDRLARFQREAEVLAALNNPHIAAIYGLERSSGVSALGWNWLKGRLWRIASRRVEFRSTRRFHLPDRSPRRWNQRTRKASSTAT